MRPDLMEKYCVRFRIGHLKAGSQPKFDCHAVAFMRLVSDTGAAIADGFHDLNLFSVSHSVFVVSHLCVQFVYSYAQYIPKYILYIRTYFFNVWCT